MTDLAPTVRQIKNATAAHFKVSVADLEGPSRMKKHAWPRQVAVYLCIHDAGKSLSETGRTFGDRDHSTVIHSLKRVEESPKRKSHAEAIRASLAGVHTPRLRTLIASQVLACRAVSEGLRCLGKETGAPT